MSQKVTFPEDFWWGAAMSGPQMEGTFEKPHENVMDYWYKTSKEEFFNGVGPTVATDFFHHYNDFIFGWDFKHSYRCKVNIHFYITMAA